MSEMINGRYLDLDDNKVCLITAIEGEDETRQEELGHVRDPFTTLRVPEEFTDVFYEWVDEADQEAYRDKETDEEFAEIMSEKDEWNATYRRQQGF